jgi:molybdenum cofactor guanylyltransferase
MKSGKMDPNLSRAAFIIAGGRSSRMGMDKAFLTFSGQTLVERALGVANLVSPHVTIVGDPAKFSKYGTVIEDFYRNAGPLAGIHAALAHSSAELNLMLAVDMPFVSRTLLEFLLTTAADSDAIVTVSRTGRGFQPLCAVYRREFASAAEQALRAGKYKIDALFAGFATRVIEESELQIAGFATKLFVNVNTPDDLSAAQSGSV